ncbi:MAG: aminotransferase class III-fold pyridoxal phosphate-dependent enzyme, partial [Kordiimonas sp.]
MSADSIETTRPEFAPAEVAAFANNYFDIAGELKALVSDRDQNFSVCNGSSNYVFKIANQNENEGFLDFQNKALLHLAETAPSLTLPRLVPTVGGEDMVEMAGQGDIAHLARVLTYVPGRLFSDVEKTPSLFSSLGAYMGKLSSGLQGFGHPAAHREGFIWNLDNVLACEPYVDVIANDDNRAIVKSYFDRYREYVLPKVSSLRSAVIHNDINDNNIIVADDTDQIAAVIDFGDMVFASQINELATALAYALFDQDDILAVSKAIISAYHSEFPLLEQEVDVLFDLTAMRLCMSVCISSQRALTDPDNEYLFISQAPAFRLLAKLIEFERDMLCDHARTACGFTVRSAKYDSHSLDEMIEHRKSVLGPSLSLAYSKHLKMVRGEGAYLYDHTGRAFLDCVNNISHVGHCHPHVVRALSDQAATLNTNTRYLHDTIQQYAERLLSTLPDPLSVVYFVCSGSEANELALRLARTKTGRKGMVVLDWAYHGNTNGLVEISPYKFNRKGGVGCPEYVRIADIADPFRGRYKGRGEDAGKAYAAGVEAAIDE